MNAWSKSDTVGRGAGIYVLMHNALLKGVEAWPSGYDVGLGIEGSDYFTSPHPVIMSTELDHEMIVIARSGSPFDSSTPLGVEIIQT